MGAAKWIGGIIGFMAGGPLGAWQVLYSVHCFDTDSSDAGSYYGEEPIARHYLYRATEQFPLLHARDGFVHYPCRRAHHA